MRVDETLVYRGWINSLRDRAGRARIQVRAAGEGDADFEVRASNLEIQQARKGARLEAGSPATLTWEADVVAANSPWVAVVVVNGDVEQRQEVSHFAIPRRP